MLRPLQQSPLPLQSSARHTSGFRRLTANVTFVRTAARVFGSREGICKSEEPTDKSAQLGNFDVI